MPKASLIPAPSSFDSLEKTEFYKLLVNSIQDYAIFLLDTRGNVASWNLGAQKLKGYMAHEIIGKHFSVFYTKQDADKPPKMLSASRRYGHVEAEGWRVKKDGSHFWANVVITALRDNSGRLIGYAKVTRNLTERKKQEDALAQAYEQLKEQSKILEEMNISKDEFISLASHQLRTPATGVKQFLGLLLEGYAGPLDKRQKHFIQRAYESNNRQIELVNDLLRVAQIDAGKVTLTTSTMDIRPLLQEAIEELRDSFASRKQQVIARISSRPVVAEVDTMRFRMVLENLIDNASKYTPEGGAIQIATRTLKHTLRIAITDNGVGIPPESLPKLFHKFSRVPNQLSESVGGSGLGLYWAYKIMQLHGGGIRVQSEPDKGSTFEVILPKTS